jgi:16S rRNA processing protein RimM
MTEETVTIGAVTSVNAARRELRVAVRRGHGSAFESPEWLRFVLKDGRELRCKVAGVRGGDGERIVALAPGATRDAVAAMTGARIVARRKDQTQSVDGLNPDELIGFEVVEARGCSIGRVTAVFETRAHDVMEIEKLSGGVLLVPLVDDAVASIDWDEQQLVMRDLDAFAVDADDHRPTRA